jgi:hypothetical protein
MQIFLIVLGSLVILVAVAAIVIVRRAGELAAGAGQRRRPASSKSSCSGAAAARAEPALRVQGTGGAASTLPALWSHGKPLRPVRRGRPHRYRLLARESGGERPKWLVEEARAAREKKR